MAYNPTSSVAPALPEKGPGYPDWVLLATRAHVSDRRNAIAAHSLTRRGNLIQVSLFVAKPPAVSHLCVHCPGKDNQFNHHPTVIFSRDDLILFAVGFVGGDSDHFIYKAHSTHPSLHRIPGPDPDRHTRLQRLRHRAWTSRLMPLEPSESLPKPQELRFTPTKVIPLKGSILGWVDLFRGVLLCDVLDDDSKLRYIPPPPRMPGNEGIGHKGEVAIFRDICGSGEWIKCVEMDYRDVGAAPVIADGFAPDEWTAITSIRKLDWNHWERVDALDIADITVAEPFDECHDLLPEFCENEKPSLKKMPIGIPTLCEYDSGVLYLMSKLGHDDCKGWVVAIDTESKKLEAAAEFTSAECFWFRNVLLSQFILKIPE
ncbi:hypothetical protein EJB05_46434, partial [Eragrostis curvula]